MLRAKYWFADRSIAAKVVVCFGSLIAIGLCVGAVTFVSLARIETSEHRAAHSYTTLGASKAIRIDVLTQESAVRGYLLARDRNFLERAHELDAKLDASLELMTTLAPTGAAQHTRIARLKRLIAIWRAQIFASAVNDKAGGTATAVAVGAEGALGRVLQCLNEIEGDEERLLVLRAQIEAVAVASAYRVNLVGPVIAILVAAFLGWALHREIARPIGRLTHAMLKLAAGDTDLIIPTTDWRDEIGAMGRALEVFRQDTIDAKRLRKEKHDQELSTRRERESLTATMAARFEEVVGGIVEAVSTSATQMQSSAESLLGLAEWTTGEVKAVARETKHASATMHSVAAETQHLSDAVGEINLRMAHSAEVAQQAVAEAGRTTSTIEHLSRSAKQIGDIVDLINDVAKQTNLLALNATIEAARAGEAGRGFAIVALEVKTLANETARATEDIRRRIEDMQGLTAGSVMAIDQISRRIDEMARFTTEIAGSVSVQGEATRDMMRGTQATARLTADVSSQLDEVSKGAVTTGAAATDLLSSAKVLAQHSTVLQDEARRFVASVRAG